MSTKTVVDAYEYAEKEIAELEILRIGYEARIESLETALAGLCGAIAKTNGKMIDWNFASAKKEMAIVTAWHDAREALAPS